MDTLEYCKQSYHYELSRRNELRAALNLPIGLSVILSGAIYTLVVNYNWAESSNIFSYSLGLSFLLSGVFLILVIVRLVQSHVNYEYAYVPTPKEILDYREQLVEYYLKYGMTQDESQELSEQNTQVYLEQELAKNAHHNAINNNMKSGHLHNASIYLVFSLVFVMIAGALVIISK